MEDTPQIIVMLDLRQVTILQWMCPRKKDLLQTFPFYLKKMQKKRLLGGLRNSAAMEKGYYQI